MQPVHDGIEWRGVLLMMLPSRFCYYTVWWRSYNYGGKQQRQASWRQVWLHYRYIGWVAQSATLLQSPHYSVHEEDKVRHHCTTWRSPNIIHIWRWLVRASSYNSNKLTNQMQQFYKFIIWRFVSLNMFRAPPRPSSGAYNCINP